MVSFLSPSATFILHCFPRPTMGIFAPPCRASNSVLAVNTADASSTSPSHGNQNCLQTSANITQGANALQVTIERKDWDFSHKDHSDEQCTVLGCWDAGTFSSVTGSAVGVSGPLQSMFHCSLLPPGRAQCSQKIPRGHLRPAPGLHSPPAPAQVLPGVSRVDE